MALKEQISEDMKSAMKSGDKEKLETIRSIRAAILEFEKSGVDREMNNEDEITLLSQLAKKRRDSIQMYRDAGREELATKEESELAVIQTYLPKQLSEVEIAGIIEKAISENSITGPKDMGKLMGAIMPELKGKADGKIVQKIVREKLGN